MKNLNLVSHEDFQACLNERFSVKIDDANGPELELIEVKPIGEVDPGSQTRQPFSLLFRGPLNPALVQQIHLLCHSELGDIALFLVPAGPGADGLLYDATFN
jgi:hypothetical protein